MTDNKQQDKGCIDYNVEMTNEEYRERLRNIFDGITDNRKLRFYYKYISGLEKSDN